MSEQLEKIFQRGSKTYFTSSLFFPPAVRQDVIKLYAFVRTADDYVDNIPADPQGFLSFCNLYREGLSQGPTGHLVIDSFIHLAKKYGYKKEWTEAFLHSMEHDLYKRNYSTMEELIGYMYGSAEVIGLFMTRILGLPEESEPFACIQGRAMQLINFIRDIEEDAKMGRQYLPGQTRRHDLLSERVARQYPHEFNHYIRDMISQYRQWQREAEAGYKYIPKRYLIPVKTAADMYAWTADRIEQNPLIVFQRKVKPNKETILLKGFWNAILIGAGGHHHAD